MKKMILVNQVTGPMFVDMADFYLANGYEVYLLTGKIEHTAQSLNAEVSIVKLITYKRKNPITRIFTWLMFTIQAFRWLKKQRSNAEVMLVSNPPSVPLLSHFLRKKNNLIFRILIYDIYPDVLEQAGFIKKNAWISRKWRMLNSRAFTNATKLYTISDGMKEVLAQYAPNERWKVVYPWVDTSFIKPVSKNENPFVQKHKLKNKLVVLYSGNMGATHDLMPILQLAERLKDHPQYFFLFIGDGVGKQRLVSYARKEDLKNTLFLPFQSPEMLPYSLTSGDIGVVAQSSVSAQLSIPSKTFYQLAAGNAICFIGPQESELAAIISRYNCGFNLNANNLIELFNQFDTLTKDDLVKYKINARETSYLFSINNIINFL